MVPPLYRTWEYRRTPVDRLTDALAHPNLVEFLIADQRIGDIPKSVLDGLLICDESLPVLGFRQMQVSLQRATGENWLADLRPVGPDANLRTHQA